MKLYGYWRSGTSYRVRVALALKGATVEQIPVNLLEGEHHGEAYKAINPQGLVPTLLLEDGTPISQSPAIIEYLDEVLPGPKLLPQSPVDRARARQMAAMIGCDVHPLQNLRVLKYLKNDLAQDEETASRWAAHWIADGFRALESTLEQTKTLASPYLMGSAPSVPDCYLLPQMFAAKRYGVDLEPFPKLRAIRQSLEELPAVQAAHPDRQPDAK